MLELIIMLAVLGSIGRGLGFLLGGRHRRPPMDFGPMGPGMHHGPGPMNPGMHHGPMGPGMGGFGGHGGGRGGMGGFGGHGGGRH